METNTTPTAPPKSVIAKAIRVEAMAELMAARKPLTQDAINEVASRRRFRLSKDGKTLLADDGDEIAFFTGEEVEGDEAPERAPSAVLKTPGTRAEMSAEQCAAFIAEYGPDKYLDLPSGRKS